MVPKILDFSFLNTAVFRIRIRIGSKVFAPPGSDPLVRSADPDPSIIKQKSKKNFDFYCFVTSI
jgi:hypothetical protein